MGDWADGILDGDFDEETGEYIGPGDGYPRSLAREAREKKQFNKPLLTNLDAPDFIEKLREVQHLLINEGYVLTEIKKVGGGVYVRTSSGGIITLYATKKISIQGKPDEKLNKIFG